MGDRKKGFPAQRRKAVRRRLTVLGAAFVLMAGVVGFGLTDEKPRKAQMIRKESTLVKDTICKVQKLNPLKKDAYPEINKAVKEYYKKLAEKADFVESYRNIQVYTKTGNYRDSYVAFVTYGMKIKDIYTEVPGLGTLYVKKDQKSGSYKVMSGKINAQTKVYMNAMAGQQDVQALLAKVETEYKEAVQSDALLQEALEDLKNAYEDSTGS